MNHTYRFSYLTCQSCTAKVHCDDCAAELQNRLMQESGVTGAEINIPNKQLSIRTDNLEEMDLLDILEDIGIFAD